MIHTWFIWAKLLYFNDLIVWCVLDTSNQWGSAPKLGSEYLMGFIHICLVVSTTLKNTSQLGWPVQTHGKIHVPNYLPNTVGAVQALLIGLWFNRLHLLSLKPASGFWQRFDCLSHILLFTPHLEPFQNCRWFSSHFACCGMQRQMGPTANRSRSLKTVHALLPVIDGLKWGLSIRKWE